MLMNAEFTTFLADAIFDIKKFSVTIGERYNVINKRQGE